jgi:hypothetical protein
MRRVREAVTANILCRYERLGGSERHALLLAFDYTKDKLELENGAFTAWRDEDKAAVARQLMQTAEESFGSNPDEACGAGLLSLYLEAQTFPGEDAKMMVSSIEEWYRRAIEKEFNRST